MIKRCNIYFWRSPIPTELARLGLDSPKTYVIMSNACDVRSTRAARCESILIINKPHCIIIYFSIKQAQRHPLSTFLSSKRSAIYSPSLSIFLSSKRSAIYSPSLSCKRSATYPILYSIIIIFNTFLFLSSVYSLFISYNTPIKTSVLIVL